MPRAVARVTMFPTPLQRIHILVFLFAFATALVAYVESTFIRDRVGEDSVGLVFTFSYAAAIGGILLLSHVVRWWGKRRTFTIAYHGVWASLLLLSVRTPSGLAVTAFTVFVVMSWVVTIGFNIVLEQYSRDASTGETRGRFLTAMNLGWIVAPLITGAIVERFGIQPVFFLSAIIVVPMSIYYSTIWKSSDDRKLHDRGALMAAVRSIVSSPALWRIVVIAFVHQLFYAWMVIYMPLHMKEGIGFSWGQIGMIFSVMLLPFVLFEFPAGRLADKWWGEKEMLMGSMILMGISTIAVAGIASANIALWMALLFLTRTGAAVVESMRDSYFYKHVDADDVATITIFHASWVLAYIVGPLLATMILWFVGYHELFQVLGGLILLSGLILIRLPDTK